MVNVPFFEESVQCPLHSTLCAPKHQALFAFVDAKPYR